MKTRRPNTHTHTQIHTDTHRMQNDEGKYSNSSFLWNYAMSTDNIFLLFEGLQCCYIQGQGVQEWSLSWTPKMTLMSVTLPIDVAWNLTEVESTATLLREFQTSYCASFLQTKPLVLQTEIIATDCDSHMKHFVNTPCGQNTDLLEVKAVVLSCECLDSFSMAQQLLTSHAPLIIESSRSHSKHATLGMTPLDELQSDAEIYIWQHTPLTRDVHVPSGIRTCNPGKWEASDPREYLGGVRQKNSLICHLDTANLIMRRDVCTITKTEHKMFLHTKYMQDDSRISTTLPLERI